MNIKNLGEHNIQVAANHLTLSRALVGQAHYDEALEHARAGYAIFQSVLGKDHLFTAAARSYVGDAEWRSGDMARGRATLESALKVQLEGGKGTGGARRRPCSGWRRRISRLAMPAPRNPVSGGRLNFD